MLSEHVRRRTVGPLLLAALGCTALALSGRSGATQPADAKIDFAHDVLPVLKARCAECHTNGKYRADLSLDTREDLLKSKAVVPGKSAESELFRRITSTDAAERMPSKGPPLSAKEIASIRAWIDQGVAWEAGFSFKASAYVAPLKPRRPDVPAASPGLEHPIDRILQPYFARHNVRLQPLDDVALVRRLYLDLIGLLPTPADVEAFTQDAAPDKRSRLVERLLDERRAYADHWLSFWNDLLRNDYAGTGYIDGGRKQITSWLYRSLRDNKPYDQFVRELINPMPQSEGFINGIKWRGVVNASQVPELQFAQNISQVFFGANLKCASCHDSFIDSWKLDDAYGLAAIVAKDRLEIFRCDKPTGKVATAHFLWPELGDIDPNQPRAERLERLAQLVTHPDNGRFTRTLANRLWQRLMGRGIVHPVDVMANRPWSDDLLDLLAVYLSDNGYDQKKLLEFIVTSRAYQSRAAVLTEEPVAGEYVFRGPEFRRMTVEQFVDAIWMITDTAPAKAKAAVALPAFRDDTPTSQRFIRASLVSSDALMRSLGRPNREQVVTTRPDQLSTLQALDLANGPILSDLLAKGAKNLMRELGDADRDRVVEAVYRRALSRSPTAEESAVARDIVGTSLTADGLADLLWTVVMLPEFQLIR
jgi:Protein of unknown function (DUF1549)/Protein of unknown function (DUF1553)/Planctomycete cytochrome C